MAVSSLRPGRWLLAVPVSLLLHGLVLWTFAQLHVPDRGKPPADVPSPVDPGLYETPGTDEPYVFLSPRRAARRPALLFTTATGQDEIVVKEAATSVVAATIYGPLPPLPVEGGQGGADGRSGSESARGSAFFGIRAEPKKVVYVIDRSASMGLHGALDAAKRELLASLDHLPATASFQVIVYNSTARLLLPDAPRWLPAVSESRCLVAAALQKLEADGSTSHDRPLPMALALEPDTIFFLTDADDMSEQQVSTVTAHNCGRSVIHAIELNTDNRSHTDKPLQVLARQNRGAYQAIDLDAYR